MYSVVAGDTFALIARKQYGDEQGASNIASANPGASEPLAAGTLLVVPAQPNAPQDSPQAPPADDRDEVAISIGGERFRFWTAVRITRAEDNLDTVEFSAPFDPDLPALRRALRPFSYQPLDVFVGGEQLFAGTLVEVNPTVGDDATTIQAGGYALPGVLADCTMPASAYPIEFNDVALPEIAATLAKPFGVAVQFDDDGGAPFERVALVPGSKVLPFLVGLAKQRNLVISSTTGGALRFWRSAAPTTPVARLQQGDAPVVSVEPFFRPQDYYSHITGLEQIYVGEYGAQFTAQNSRLAGVLRPASFTARDTVGGDVKTAVDAAAGRMFGGAAAYVVEVATWRDPQGELWATNTSIDLLAPGAMVYDWYTFEIRGVAFSTDDKKRSAVLSLVIPGAFSGTIPEALPWDG